MNLVFQEGGCPTCTADFMHAVAFNSEADLAWSKGFVVLENSTTVPEFTLEEVCALLDVADGALLQLVMR